MHTKKEEEQTLEHGFEFVVAPEVAACAGRCSRDTEPLWERASLLCARYSRETGVPVCGAGHGTRADADEGVAGGEVRGGHRGRGRDVRDDGPLGRERVERVEERGGERGGERERGGAHDEVVPDAGAEDAEALRGGRGADGAVDVGVELGHDEEVQLDADGVQRVALDRSRERVA